MMVELEDIAQLVQRGYETKDVDYKGPMEWNEADKKACCELVKDILAIANTQGGFIVIGVAEVEGLFCPEGLSSAQVSSFESTRLANFVQKYADPPINTTVRVVQPGQMSFVVIQIPRFPKEPHICVKEFPGVLSSPTIYIRTDNNESAPLGRSSDFRALLETALRNKTDELLISVRAVLTGANTNPPQGDDSTLFKEQFKSAVQAFEAKNAYPEQPYEAYREITSHPSEFNNNRFDITDLDRAMRASNVNYRGLAFLTRDEQTGQNTYRIQDGYETYITLKDFHSNDRMIFWQLRTSGLFYHRLLVREEGMARRQNTGPFLDIRETLYHFAEAIHTIVLLYQELELPPDEAVTINARYLGMNNRRLIAMDSMFPELNYGMSHIPEIAKESTRTLAEWTAGARDYAVEIATDFFRLFNINETEPRGYRELIDRLFERRL